MELSAGAACSSAIVWPEQPQLSRPDWKLVHGNGAVLLIAKLNRLAWNVAFIANLLESGIEVTAATKRAHLEWYFMWYNLK